VHFWQEGNKEKMTCIVVRTILSKPKIKEHGLMVSSDLGISL
jgi:hypothetical protein